jgi:PAS domain S-box-containing protein
MNNPTGISFDALFSNAAMGMLVADGSGNIVLTNPFLLKQFGYTEQELSGKPIEKLIPMRFHRRHENHVQQYNEHPKNRPMGLGLDLYAARKDGTEFPVEVSLGKYTTDAGQFVIAFVSDISKRKEAEAAVQLLNEELEQKIETRTQNLKQVESDLRVALEKEKELSELKSRFVSMASHEFRTPLSTVLSSAYLVSKYSEKEEQPKREKHIQRIVSSVNMLTDILNDFLSVGRIEEGRIQVRYSTFDLPQHLRQIISELNGLLKQGQEIVYLHEGDTQVELDSSLLKHVAINLLSNAIKFSSESGRIECRSIQEQGRVTVAVSDNGIGISAEDQLHLAERFFRGTNATNIQGTGLGLHIVSKYAELMNGTLHWDSALNEGTTFTIRFGNREQG